MQAFAIGDKVEVVDKDVKVWRKQRGTKGMAGQEHELVHVCNGMHSKTWGPMGSGPVHGHKARAPGGPKLYR